MKRTTVKMILVAMALLVYVMAAYALVEARVPAPQWDSGHFYAVESPVFDSAMYDAEDQTLTLLFRSGAAYEYYGVSHKTWLTFMRVTYKGSFFNAHIRRAYPYRFIGYAP